jgi:hypothetical protein
MYPTQTAWPHVEHGMASQSWWTLCNPQQISRMQNTTTRVSVISFLDLDGSLKVHNVVLNKIHCTRFVIMESVDSRSRDGPDMIYVIHYKKVNNSEQLKFQDF